MAKTPRVPGEPESTGSTDVRDDPAQPGPDDEGEAGDGDPTGATVEQLTDAIVRLSDRVADLEAVVEAMAARIGQAPAQGGLPPTTAPELPSQDQALAQANELGRAVLSRDGWVAPTKVAPPPPMMQVGGPR